MRPIGYLDFCFLGADAGRKAVEQRDPLARFLPQFEPHQVPKGHQLHVQQQGGQIVRAERLMHGKTSMVSHDGETIYRGLSDPFEVGRYHSLCAEHDSLPDTLVVTAQTDRGEIMGVRHKTLPIEGVQFHPESVLTPEGDKLMVNFMRMGAS